MNKYLGLTLLLALVICSFTAPDNRTLFTVGNEPVTVNEFEYVYNKNNVNNQADYSEKSLRDYLNLYENFRLKVREAETMHLDTISSLKSELEGYRKQLAKSYLTDREITDKLINEAYERSKIEINASHILIKCDENANPADTLVAYKKIMAIKKRLEKGESLGTSNAGGAIGWAGGADGRGAVGTLAAAGAACGCGRKVGPSGRRMGAELIPGGKGGNSGTAGAEARPDAEATTPPIRYSAS